MEINHEELRTMSTADLASLIHLYRSYPSIDHSPAEYHTEVMRTLQTELDTRLRKIFIY